MALTENMEEHGQQGRPLDEIARDIDVLDARIEELGRQRSALVAEHDEAAERIHPRQWVI